ncbi:MAG TPA: thiamine ABC transporter substrate binding subunit [Verrucomicrobiae bacterium]|nr:thiamine ABC transporter substrate binding subunit [Verrucomicrobiae bacterium]
MRFLIAVLALLVTAGAAQAADPPVLTIYTYNSFTSEWGPGPAVQKAFEADCACKIEYVAVEDGAALLSRLLLEGKNTKADIVLGLDTNLTAEAAATGLFAPHGMDLSALTLPMAWSDPVFVPYDYGYFAFVYDSQKITAPPKSFEELLNGPADWQILIQDPRSSTPGLGLLMWVRKLYGDRAPEIWQKLRPRIVTVSKGWSEAYGLFLNGEAPMVLSYTTSPAYHIIAEKTDRYRAAEFSEGHYMQVEVAARTSTSAHADLAEKFLAFMTGPGFQDVIPTTNWMYPVIEPAGGLPEAFAQQPVPQPALLYTADEAAAGRKAWIDEWLAAMGN